MPEPKRDRPSWLRYTSVGTEFFAVVLGFGLVGVWVDGRWGTKPWGVLIGAALGLIGGTYNLVRESLAAFQPPKKPDRRQNEDHPRQP